MTGSEVPVVPTVSTSLQALALVVPTVTTSLQALALDDGWPRQLQPEPTIVANDELEESGQLNALRVTVISLSQVRLQVENVIKFQSGSCSDCPTLRPVEFDGEFNYASARF